MNKRKLKDLDDISSRQFRRRVHYAVMNVMEKVTPCENKMFENNTANLYNDSDDTTLNT